MGSPDQSAGSPLANAGGNHDERIFDTLPEGAFVDETTVPPPRPPGAKPVPFYKGLEELQVGRDEGGRGRQHKGGGGRRLPRDAFM